MLRWLTKLLSWLFREEPALYHPHDRLIYQYFDGQSVIRADPMVLYKKMMSQGPSLAIDIKVANSPSKAAAGAHENFVKTVREVFSLKTLEHGGLTELEAAELLDHFLRFCEGCKKKSKSLATSPGATPAASAPTTGASPPTTNSSDSGSTANVPSTEPPPPSPSELVSPSA